jgi:hypothetical protein
MPQDEKNKSEQNETNCLMGAHFRECDTTSKTYPMIGCDVVQFRRSHCKSPSLKSDDFCYL